MCALSVPPLALVCGGSRGIGYAIAAALGASGRYRVAVLSRSAEGAAAAAASLPALPRLEGAGGAAPDHLGAPPTCPLPAATF
jgi:NAD(P)-dependent dehydrogenase (short-subunit alcohol dehydrogenase family)